MERECDTERNSEHSSGNDYSPSIDVHVIVSTLFLIYLATRIIY